MKLIICEKPSVALDIARALGNFQKHDGHYTAGGYTITHAVGHLLEGDDSVFPEKWKLELLPAIPALYKKKPAGRTYSQFKIVSGLVKQASEVINMGDAGREGELIVREILDSCHYKGPLKRVWTSEALTKEVVLRELKSGLKDGHAYDSMYEAAKARENGDMLVGFNYTRAVTIKAGGFGQVWSVGRVQTPVLRLIVDRDIERENFKSEEYFLITAQFDKAGEKYNGILFNPKTSQQAAQTNEEVAEKDDRQEDDISSRIKSKDTADRILADIKKVGTGMIKEVKKEVKKDLPPLLHSLTSLQMEANGLYGFPAKKTLDIAQKLYEEHKAASYPRVDAQHLGNDAVGLAKDVLGKLGKPELAAQVMRYGKRVFDSSKLTDHHAIIPLKPKPANLDSDETKIYDLIWRKFVGAFMDPYEYKTTSVVTQAGNYLFRSNGKVENKLGWKALYKGHQSPAKEQEASLPELSQDETVKKAGEGSESKFTQPAAPYTEKSILLKMKKLMLGTPATRAQIIETLKKRTYITSQGKALISGLKGRELIKNLRSNKIIDTKTTGEWEDALEKIWTQKQGASGYTTFMKSIDQFVRESVEDIKGMDIQKVNVASSKMLQAAKSIAREKRLRLTDTTFEGVKAFLDQHSDRKDRDNGDGTFKPSEKQVSYANSLAQRMGTSVPAEALKDGKVMKTWIDKAVKKAPPTLSEKQIAVLEKHGQAALVNDPVAAKKWIDEYFKSKGGSGGGYRKSGYKRNFKRSYPSGGYPGR